MTLNDHTDVLKGKVHVNVHIGACMYKGEKQHCAELLIYLDDKLKKILQASFIMQIGIEDGIYSWCNSK